MGWPSCWEFWREGVYFHLKCFDDVYGTGFDEIGYIHERYFLSFDEFVHNAFSPCPFRQYLSCFPNHPGILEKKPRKSIIFDNEGFKRDIFARD